LLVIRHWPGWFIQAPSGPAPTGCLEVAPCRVDALGSWFRPCGPELRHELGHFTLYQDQLVPLNRDLPFQHLNSLTVASGKSLGHRDRLAVRHLGSQAASPLRRFQIASLGLQLPLGGRKRVSDGTHSHFGLDKSLA
jgi:hypothetical protein